MFRNRDRMIKIFVWLIVLTMVLSFAAFLSPALS